MISLPLLTLAGCLTVTAGSDRILMRDLAAALPSLAGVTPDAPVALAPAPGVRRIFRVAELERVYARLHLAAAPEREVCFERAMAAPEQARLLLAMQRELPQAAIEILDYSRFPVPDGDLEFPLSGLRSSPQESYWAGSVRYAGNRRFVLWARVKIAVSTSRVVATEDLKPGVLLDANRIRIETHDGLPEAGYLTSIEDTAGKRLRRMVRSGTALRADWLEPAYEIARGDTVDVEVRCGAAALKLEGRAEASGAIGQTISVFNPLSHRRFSARVQGKGRVMVERNPQ
jgi:flagella basal body P-ring formation protein FlgA